MIYFDKIIKLTKQLYPTGRAFKMPKGGWLETLHNGLSQSENRAYSDAVSTLNSILPDNVNFTTSDATDWEQRLGLITNESVSLSDRKAAIIRKMNHPGNIPARQNYRYVESQLRLAGFDVYVHENPNGYTPEQIITLVGVGQHGDGQHGDFQHGDVYTINPTFFQEFQHDVFQHGDSVHGGFIFLNKVVNYLERLKDQSFNPGLSYRGVFYIGGENFGTFADVDSDRETEFRQLILKLKPTRTASFLLINYI